MVEENKQRIIDIIEALKKVTIPPTKTNGAAKAYRDGQDLVIKLKNGEPCDYNELKNIMEALVEVTLPPAETNGAFEAGRKAIAFVKEMKNRE